MWSMMCIHCITRVVASNQCINIIIYSQQCDVFIYDSCMKGTTYKNYKDCRKCYTYNMSVLDVTMYVAF